MLPVVRPIRHRPERLADSQPPADRVAWWQERVRRVRGLLD
jgi:hypothetical protein